MLDSTDVANINADLSEQGKPPSMLGRINNLVQHDLSGTIFQFFKGATLAGTATFGGMWGTIAAGLGLIATGFYKLHLKKNYQKQQLLNLYRDEIASLTGKDVQQLTLKDLETAAGISANGSKNAIAREIEIIEHNAKVHGIIGVVTTVLMTAAAAFANSRFDATKLQEFSSYTIAVSGLVTQLAHNLVGVTLSGLFQPKDYNVNHEICELTRQLKHHAVTPERVFSVFVEADPALKQHIQQRHGDKYQNLTVMAKQELIEGYEQKYNTKAITEAINARRIKPTELGFIAYDQCSGFNPLVHPISPGVESDFKSRHYDPFAPEHAKYGERLMLERLRNSDAGKTLH